MKLTKITSILAGAILGLILMAKPALAITSTITVQDLPEYLNYNTFKISYSAVNNDPSNIKVQFYVNKDGGAYSAFGGQISGASGQVQVEPGQVNETGKKYCFKAEIVGDAVTDETCTTFIQRTPEAPRDYWKERISGGLYRIHWKTPNEDEFSRVFVYRSTNINFTAEDSTKVAEVGGAKDTEIAWDNYGVTEGTEYYYLLRAIDKAGNASNLVGDTSVTTTETVVTQEEGTERVTVLPQEEEPQGQVLAAEEEDPTTIGEQAKNVVEKVTQFAKDRTKITIGLIIIAALIIRIIIKTIKKRKI